ncbi:MAG: hypothetical protein QXF80_06895 [Thermoplasmatales archaeon]
MIKLGFELVGRLKNIKNVELINNISYNEVKNLDFPQRHESARLGVAIYLGVYDIEIDTVLEVRFQVRVNKEWKSVMFRIPITAGMNKFDLFVGDVWCKIYQAATVDKKP